MKFTGGVFFPELADRPETGSGAWIRDALDYAQRCGALETSILVVCKACGWHHESKTMDTCLSCGSPLDKLEFGEHERADVLCAMHRLEIRSLAGRRPLILK